MCFFSYRCAIDIISEKNWFEEYAVQKQDFLSTEEKHSNILRLVPDDHILKRFRLRAICWSKVGVKSNDLPSACLLIICRQHDWRNYKAYSSRNDVFTSFILCWMGADIAVLATNKLWLVRPPFIIHFAFSLRSRHDTAIFCITRHRCW